MQTAVEWLQSELKKCVEFNPLDKNSYVNNVDNLFKEALKMEKEQIINAYTSDNIFHWTSNYYYEKTFDKL
jgi:hypothetical protein